MLKRRQYYVGTAGDPLNGSLSRHRRAEWEHTVSVPGYGAVEVDLCGNEAIEAYGEVLLSPTHSGSLVAEVVRANAEDTVEFSVGFRD